MNKQFWLEVRDNYKAATTDNPYICGNSDVFAAEWRKKEFCLECWRLAEIFLSLKKAGPYKNPFKHCEVLFSGDDIDFYPGDDVFSVKRLNIRRDFLDWVINYETF